MVRRLGPAAPSEASSSCDMPPSGLTGGLGLQTGIDKPAGIEAAVLRMACDACWGGAENADGAVPGIWGMDICCCLMSVTSIFGMIWAYGLGPA